MMSLGIVDSYVVNIDDFYKIMLVGYKKMLFISNIKWFIILNLYNFFCQQKICEKIVKDEVIFQQGRKRGRGFMVFLLVKVLRLGKGKINFKGGY